MNERATSSTRPAILITGATGTIGGQVARRLTAQGRHVAVASRRPEQLADLVADSDGLAEARRLDLEDPATFDAFDGIHTLFLLGPIGPDFGERVAVAVKAAAKAGVQHVVRYSALGANPEASSVLARQHGLADRAVADSGMDWTILQPTFYQDNFLNFQGEAIRRTDAFYGASGEGRSAYVASADLADVAAQILREPAAHASQRYVLTGPEALTDTEVADRLSKAIDHTVRYVDVGDESVGQSLRDQGAAPWFADSMVVLEQVKRNGWAAEVSPTVEKILGRPARPIEAFFQANAASFR